MLDPTDLSPLGAAMEEGRLATGLSTEAFLRAHRLSFRTWHRLLRGEPVVGRRPPLVGTIVRYGCAAGLDKEAALVLARQSYLSRSADELTRLGTALEDCRLATGLDTRPFLAGRGLSITTWYRLLYGAGTMPRRDTLIKYVREVGLDLATAVDLFKEDCRSGRFSPKSGHRTASDVALRGSGGGSVDDPVDSATR